MSVIGPVTYASFLVNRGLKASAPMNMGFLRYIARREWAFEVITALKDEPKLLAFFFQRHGFDSLNQAIPMLLEDPKMSFSLSRGFELHIQQFLSGEVGGNTNIRAIDFQLDKEAATFLGEVTLKDPRDWLAWDVKNQGVLYQRNMPTELADRLLLTHSSRIMSPLHKWRYSEKALRTVAKFDSDKIADSVQLTNPYISDARFQGLLRSGTIMSWLSWNIFEFTPERWEMVLDEFLPRFGVGPLYKIASNPSLPYDLALRMFDSSPELRGIPYAGKNAHIVFDGQYALKSKEANWGLIMSSFTRPEDIERFALLLDNYDGARLVMSNPHSSPELVDYLVDKWSAKINSDSGLFVDAYVEFEEPNFAGLQIEYLGYKDFYTPKSKEKFEQRLDSVLIRHGAEEALGSPVSWKMEMLSLFQEKVEV